MNRRAFIRLGAMAAAGAAALGFSKPAQAEPPQPRKRYTANQFYGESIDQQKWLLDPDCPPGRIYLVSAPTQKFNYQQLGYDLKMYRDENAF